MDDKKCYVKYLLAFSYYANNDHNKAEQQLHDIEQVCRAARHVDIKKIIAYDLELAQKNSMLSTATNEFKNQNLKNQ